jgi:hypothetical protein
MATPFSCAQCGSDEVEHGGPGAGFGAVCTACGAVVDHDATALLEHGGGPWTGRSAAMTFQDDGAAAAWHLLADSAAGARGGGRPPHCFPDAAQAAATRSARSRRVKQVRVCGGEVFSAGVAPRLALKQARCCAGVLRLPHHGRLCGRRLRPGGAGRGRVRGVHGRSGGWGRVFGGQTAWVRPHSPVWQSPETRALTRHPPSRLPVTLPEVASAARCHARDVARSCVRLGAMQPAAGPSASPAAVPPVDTAALVRRRRASFCHSPWL